MRQLIQKLICEICVICGSFLILIAGCIDTGKPRAATRPSTAIDEEVATNEYWLKKPGVAGARSEAFFTMWQACEHELQRRGFEVDRRDERRALMTSKPLVSKAFLEVWRQDVVGGRESTESMLATIRRTVYLNVSRDIHGAYRMEPKVLVERYSQEEHRITAAVSYEQVFLRTPPEEERALEEENWPAMYWYAIGRDEKLEKALALEIQEEIASKAAVEPATRVGG